MRRGRQGDVVFHNQALRLDLSEVGGALSENHAVVSHVSARSEINPTAVLSRKYS